jgi:transposase
MYEYHKFVYTGGYMATIQCKPSRGHKYWSIVESRRVNGKPRPVVLEYLGTAEGLLKRLAGLKEGIKVKSYSHGLVAALLAVADKLEVCNIINQSIESSKDYMAKKPIRNYLTAGATLMLAALGRACIVTSKMAWSEWAKTTSLEYLLRVSFSKIDSQHFWDMMDAMPVERIADVEESILKNVMKLYDIKTDSLFYDTTNFYTFINTTNQHCKVAQRGKNKQKRNDLRQVGMALVVNKHDMVPLFHHTYEGNTNDAKVFKSVVEKIKNRLCSLGMDVNSHTLVFDRGNNSKKNIELVKSLEMHYVGALTPYHHKELISVASKNFKDVSLDLKTISSYREKKTIWGHDMTVIVVISDKLKEGQIRGIYTCMTNCENAIIKMNKTLKKCTKKKRKKEKIEDIIRSLVARYKLTDIIDYQVFEDAESCFEIRYLINYGNLAKLEEDMGFRIIMTDRHNWETSEIISAYQGQSFVENTFKNMKNHRHLSFNPQFHWTEQKIKVHNFYCVLSYLMSSLIMKDAKEKAGFEGNMNTLLNILSNVRLGSVIEVSGKKGKPKAVYLLETTNNKESHLLNSLNLDNIHIKRPKINGLSVYN